MAFTRQHYIKIASLINIYLEEESSSFDDFLFSLTDYFKQDNKNFDKEKFIKACYKTLDKSS